MKPKLLIGTLLLLVALGPAACGEDSSEPETSRAATTVEASTEEAAKPKGAPAPPKIDIPTGDSPPKQVVVKTLKKGSGPAIEQGRRATANYVAFRYRSGERSEDHWGKAAFEWLVGGGGASKGWEIGVKGMRVGEQRMLVIPSNLAYRTGARVFLVELLAIE